MDRSQLIEEAKALAARRVTPAMDMDEKIDVLEMAMMELLDVQIMKPPIGRAGATASGEFDGRPHGKWLMHEDPRLPEMPARPTLIDFFKLRFAYDTVGYNHLLQSAKLAKDKGLPDNTVLACLLHDVSVVGLIRTDHGHWAAQLVEPYVDPEVHWAIKHHQALRFRPDPEYDYAYPKTYLAVFGGDYDPPDYVKAEWEYCRNHEWYPHAMAVVVNDLYSFDPNARVEIEEFEDVIARKFRTPPEGLGFDRSPVAHMWRTIIWPNNFL
ncbi:MAG: hypothetical protein AAF415_02805 [Pseudomonadota bacterium]